MGGVLEVRESCFRFVATTPKHRLDALTISRQNHYILSSMGDFQLWKDLLEFARWAPSPHNVQPWKVKLNSATQADLFYDPKRLLPDEDPEGIFMTVGLGIFIEMLSIAAKGSGYSLEIKYDGARLNKSKTRPELFAHLALQRGEETETLSRDLIKERRTSRLPYHGRPVSDAVLEELKSIAQAFGQSFTFSSDPQLVDWVVRLNKDTMLYDMNDKRTREEVRLWVRYSSREAAQARDGLWAYCMNVAPWLMYIFFNARWIIKLPGIYQMTGRVYLRTMKGTKTVGWLQGSLAAPHDWVKAGRMLARLWLTMTKYGIGLHPFGSIITNEIAHERLREKFKVDERQGMLWLIMRLGYSEVPPRSHRLSVDEILI